MNFIERNFFNNPSFLEEQISNALIGQNPLQAKILHAIGVKIEIFQNIAKSILTQNENKQSEIQHTLEEVTNWSNLHGKSRLDSILKEIFLLSDEGKVDEAMQLFFAVGGSFKQFNNYVIHHPSFKDMGEYVRFLDVVRRIISIETQYLQDSIPKNKQETSLYEIKKTTALLQQHFHSNANVYLFHHACKLGLKDLVIDILDSGVDVDAPNPKNGCTALHVAAWNGKLEIVELLLSKGAKINFRNKEAENPRKKTKTGKATPLHMAASQGHANVVSYLISKGADAYASCTQGKTALHHAIDKGDVQTIEALLNNKAKVNAPSNLGTTPLHCACLLGRVDLIKMFLKYGADPLLKDYYRETPFEALQKQTSKDVLVQLFADFPVIISLLQNPVEQLLPKLRSEPSILLESSEDISKRNPLEAVLLIGDRELAHSIAKLMPPDQYEKALDALTKKYHPNSLKLLFDAHLRLKKEIVYQISSQEKIPPVAPLDLNLFMSLFGKVDFKFSPKLKNIKPEAIFIDENGLWTSDKFTLENPKLEVEANEFVNVPYEELTFDSEGNITIGEISVPYLILKVGNQEYPAILKEENGVKKIEVNIEMLLSLFDKINFQNPEMPGYCDPKSINDATGTLGPEREIVSVENLQIGLQNFVTYVKNRVPLLFAPPASEPEKLEEWYKYIEATTLTVVRKALVEDFEAKANEEKDPTPSRPTVITYAITGLWCGTRFLDDCQFLYDTKANNIRTLKDQVLNSLNNLKMGIAETLIRKAQDHNVHEKYRILQAIDTQAGIPEEEKQNKVYFHNNKYDICSIKVDNSSVSRVFWSAFTPTKIIDLIEEPINKKSGLFNEELVFQWFKDHVPVDWEKEKYDPIYSGIKECQTLQDKVNFLEPFEILINPKALKEPDKIDWEKIIREDQVHSFMGKVLFDASSGKYTRKGIAHMLTEFGVFEKV